MTKRFTKLYSSLWRSKRFMVLTGSAKLLHLYFLSSDHQTSIGAYAIPDGYALSDLGWSAAEYEVARNELLAAGLILFDTETSTVYVTDWFKHCAPANKSHAQCCQRLISELEGEAIVEKVQADFDAVPSAAIAGSPNPTLVRAATSEGAGRWPVGIGGAA